MEFSGVDISEVIFKERLSKREFCVIFLVEHHNRGPPLPYENKLRQRGIHACEARAYRRLTETGLAGRITPEFYGVIENIDPALCQPHLEAFLEDKYTPNAILIEYIPNMEELHWTNYTEKRMQSFIDGIKEIHDIALIEHSDPHPRNMMVVKGDLERAIWIDFDRAQTFVAPITEQQRRWIASERRVVEEMDGFMRDDLAEGKTNKTAMYYY